VVNSVLYCTGYTMIKTMKLRCAAALTSKLREMGEGNNNRSSVLGSPAVLLSLREPRLCLSAYMISPLDHNPDS
jgi:hypothetical protein